MAALMRLGAVRSLANSFARSAFKGRRNINTSSGKKTVEAAGDTCAPSKKKNWVTYGYSTTDPVLDRIAMHVSSFMAISLCLVTGGIYLIFAPDPGMREWAQREAYLELRRREALGLPAVDPFYVDPDKVVLPTDEELGDTDIII
ncbi:NADH dehydrogenase [ubiquinone] 1 beta subcomplex subunit 11, mitochondrial [Venturia canescens]|uniref:NADH dehydrogenase [ubiquinone] 1 beta subcomplex subunit 11, mitochondrial n=1 Tax=Venturia canescens TaxID=32260 RepID=UPI001C9CF51B|nr:NADH dehydrogenase [ubiquinone] 1 beta subcomplex subunit 11, mitochondrial [Venturia canescens]